MFEIKEVTFPSGAKAKYLFVANQIIESASQIDELEALERFQIRGPLTESMNENSPRYQEFILSRVLLLELLRDSKKNNQRNLAISLSHTKGAALVAALPSVVASGVSLACGIGVDLESSERKISDAAFKRLLVNENEKHIAPLDLWCLKEAAFKAHPHNQTLNDGLLLSDFHVETDLSVECLRSKMKFETHMLTVDSYKLVFAIQKRNTL